MTAANARGVSWPFRSWTSQTVFITIQQFSPRSAIQGSAALPPAEDQQQDAGDHGQPGGGVGRPLKRASQRASIVNQAAVFSGSMTAFENTGVGGVGSIGAPLSTAAATGRLAYSFPSPVHEGMHI